MLISRLLYVFAKRNYTAQPVTKCSAKKTQRKEPVFETTVLENKIVVASLDCESPVARVSIVFRAGSRYEHTNILGATHMLRIAAGLGTCCFSSFGITKNIQQIGGNLSCRSDRDMIAYTVECTRDKLPTAVKYLKEVATKQAFKPWELLDSLPRLKSELSAVPPQARVLDAVNRAAFHDGLANSIFCPDYMVGHHSPESLKKYVETLFTTDRCAVVGVGVQHNTLKSLANGLELPKCPMMPLTSEYYGGAEVRLDSASDIVHMVAVVKGAGIKCEKSALELGVLQHAMGVGPPAKWGCGAGTLSKAVCRKPGTTHFSISALNINYSDMGLFGFIASCPSVIAGLVLRAGVQVMKYDTVKECDIIRGKALLKASILYGRDNGAATLEELGMRAAMLGKVPNDADLIKAVDALNVEDIKARAAELCCSKIALAATGKLCCLPHVSSL